MEPFDWPTFLRDLSDLLLENDAAAFAEYGFYQIPEEYHMRGYLGYPSASEEQIAAAEARLGAEFLRKTRLRKARRTNRFHLKPKGAPGTAIRSFGILCNPSVISLRDTIRTHGLRLPASYRAFLKASNGWGHMGVTSPGKLWSTDEIEWLWVRNQEDIDLWGNPLDNDATPEEHLRDRGSSVSYRGVYMQHCLEISDWGDACILFLCPEVVTPDGEWECWHLASWYPGAARTASFQEWFEERAARERRKLERRKSD